MLKRISQLLLFIAVSLIGFTSCHEEPKQEAPKPKERVFEGFHPLMDEIVLSKNHVFRGLDLDMNADSILKAEKNQPIEKENNRLYFEYSPDSITNYSIDYSLVADSLEEINVQINCKDLELCSYLFCDLKDYYANKLPNPIEDQGAVVYNCYEGKRMPFVVSLSDNSTPNQGIINMVIYKDR
ncbi:MAG: hypothetical protein AB7O73_00380 [Bacteroidia bacterium]